jgi:hypothetical protein
MRMELHWKNHAVVAGAVVIPAVADRSLQIGRRFCYHWHCHTDSRSYCHWHRRTDSRYYDILVQPF